METTGTEAAEATEQSRVPVGRLEIRATPVWRVRLVEEEAPDTALGVAGPAGSRTPARQVTTAAKRDARMMEVAVVTAEPAVTVTQGARERLRGEVPVKGWAEAQLGWVGAQVQGWAEVPAWGVEGRSTVNTVVCA